MNFTCGTDIIEIDRIKKSIEQLEEKFLNKIYTEKEIMYCEGKKKAKYQHYAARFAAKEAVSKALGTGFRDGIYLADIEIISDEWGKPFVELKANALLRAKNIGIKKIHLTLSDDAPFVAATAVAEM